LIPNYNNADSVYLWRPFLGWLQLSMGGGHSPFVVESVTLLSARDAVIMAVVVAFTKHGNAH
jgi:hypothetical protein